MFEIMMNCIEMAKKHVLNARYLAIFEYTAIKMKCDANKHRY